MVSSVVLHLTRTMFNEGKIRCSDGVTQRALNFSTAVAAVTSLCMANHLHWLPRSFVAQVRRFDGVLYNPRLPPPLNYVTTLRRENYTIVMNLPLRVGKQLYSRLSTQRMYYAVYCRQRRWGCIAVFYLAFALSLADRSTSGLPRTLSLARFSHIH